MYDLHNLTKEELEFIKTGKTLSLPSYSETPIPKQVIFRNPYTIVNWDDGTKTIVKCMRSDEFNKEMGFLACLAKKVYGGHNPYKKFIENAVVQKTIPGNDETNDEMPF